jgi:hypothetical protein
MLTFPEKVRAVKRLKQGFLLQRIQPAVLFSQSYTPHVPPHQGRCSSEASGWMDGSEVGHGEQRNLLARRLNWEAESKPQARMRTHRSIFRLGRTSCREVSRAPAAGPPASGTQQQFPDLPSNSFHPPCAGNGSEMSLEIEQDKGHLPQNLLMCFKWGPWAHFGGLCILVMGDPSMLDYCRITHALRLHTIWVSYHSWANHDPYIHSFNYYYNHCHRGLF